MQIINCSLYPLNLSSTIAPHSAKRTHDLDSAFQRGLCNTSNNLSLFPSHNLNNTSAHPKPPVDQFDEIDIVVTCVLSLSFVLSLLGNGVLAWTIWKKHGAKGPAGEQFLLHLTAVNLLQTMVILPLHLANKMTNHRLGRWFVEPDHERRCLAFGFGLDFLMRISWMMVALIAFERHTAIVRHPMEYRKQMSKSMAGGLLGSSWGLSLFIALIYWVYARGGNDYLPARYFCSFSQTGYFIYLSVDFTFSFLLPFIVMVVCWGHIAHKALQKTLQVRLGIIAALPIPDSEQPPPATATTSETSAPPTGTFSGMFRRSSSRDSIGSYGSSISTARKPSATLLYHNTTYRAIGVAAIIVGSYFLTAGLYVIATLTESLVHFPTAHHSWLTAIGYTAPFLSSATYPYVYGCLNRSIRSAVRCVFRATFRRASLPTSQAGGPRRRWSISSHVLDYLPALPSSRSGSGSRRTSVDSAANGGHPLAHRCTPHCREGCVDAGSTSSSVFRNFCASKPARRRVSAPSLLQHSTVETVDGPVRRDRRIY